jgi:hypothetical protein
MHLVLVKPSQSVAANIPYRLHFRSYVSVSEWSSTRLTDSLFIALFAPSVFNVSSSVVAMGAENVVGVMGSAVPGIHAF